LPGGHEISLITERQVTDFPHPLSPTIARISFSPIEKLTLSTALISPSLVKNDVVRLFTFKIAFGISAPLSS
jgi:hypothetical protein